MLTAFIQAAIAAYALIASPMEGGGVMLIAERNGMVGGKKPIVRPAAGWTFNNTLDDVNGVMNLYPQRINGEYSFIDDSPFGTGKSLRLRECWFGDSSGKQSSILPYGNALYTCGAFVKIGNSPSTNQLGFFGYGLHASNRFNGFKIQNFYGNFRYQNYWWSNDLNSNSTIVLNSWNCVISVYDGEKRTLYINGIAAGELYSNAKNTISSFFAVGKSQPDNNTWTYSIDGVLSNLAIYDFPFSAKQISDFCVGGINNVYVEA